jgi:hypothetical protein
LWRLKVEGTEFKLPSHTTILGKRTVVFPYQITGLPALGYAELLYPSGELASAYPKNVAKPALQKVSYTQVKAVEEIKAPITYATATVGAPAAASELAAAGAAVTAVNTPSPKAGSGHSVWTYGVLGFLVLSGGAALILL